MLLTSVVFWQVILAVHIVAVVITFGVLFAYPVIYLFASKLDPAAMSWYYRTRTFLGRRLVSPGLLLVLVAGIYLASKLHQWHFFYVQWGLAIVVIIGGLQGAVLSRMEKTLAGNASGAENQALSRRVMVVDALILVLILITIYLMTIQAG
jgi:hypothetical protein